jgi:orotate phosphoribosyltransferase-like protein
MKNMKIKMKFVELKAAGIPMYKIAQEIGVHRTTLTHWYKELASYILIAKQDIIDELLYENCSMKISRIERISQKLTLLYELLDNKKMRKKVNQTVTGVLNQILMYTKLLKLETNEKNIEKYIKGKKEEPADEKLWITNKENFHRFQPKDEEGTDLENSVEIAEEDDSHIFDLDMDSTRDNSGDDEEVKKVYSKTFKRKFPIDTEEEKPVKNSSKRKNKKDFSEEAQQAETQQE